MYALVHKWDKCINLDGDYVKLQAGVMVTQAKCFIYIVINMLNGKSKVITQKNNMPYSWEPILW